MVWIGGTVGTKDEFLTYLKNKEFVSENAIESQYRMQDALFPLRKQLTTYFLLFSVVFC